MGVRGRLAMVMIVLFGLVLAACDPEDGGGADPPPTGPAPSAQIGPGDGSGKQPGCGSSAGRAAALLPAFDGNTAVQTKIRTVTTNPCFDAIGMVAQVLDVLPEGGRGKVPLFVEDVKKIAGGLTTITDQVGCAYEADRLAIRIYRHPDFPLSVGVVAVVRGTYGVAIDAAICYLKGIVPPDILRSAPSPGPPSPTYIPCAHAKAGTRKEDGQFYTVVWAGSSDWMCGALDSRLQH